MGCPKCRGRGFIYDRHNRTAHRCAECDLREKLEREGVEEEPSGKTSLRLKFEEFHHNHPEVYAEMVRLARKAKGKGRTRIGAKALWEVMRWNFWMKWGDNEEFKLCNNHHAYYARLIMEQEGDLKGLFQLRKVKGE